MNSVILQVYNDRIYLQNRLRNLQLISGNPFLAELIFKIGSLNLFDTETTFRYCNLIKFRRRKSGINLLKFGKF